MAPPTSSASRIVTLLLKVFNFVLLLISLIVLTTDTATAYTEVLTFKVRFNDIYAYSTGALIRDGEGKVIGALSKKITAPLKALEIEAKAVEVGLQFAKDLSIQEFILEGDSLLVINALKELSLPPSSVAAIISSSMTVSHEFRYMLATNVIGFAYTLLQIAFSICHIIMGNHLISGDGGALLDFYGDKVISYLLATGAAAGFGVTVDLKETFGLFIDRSFYEKAYASDSLLLLAFVCTAILSVISSCAVPKKV